VRGLMTDHKQPRRQDASPVGRLSHPERSVSGEAIPRSASQPKEPDAVLFLHCHKASKLQVGRVASRSGRQPSGMMLSTKDEQRQARRGRTGSTIYSCLVSLVDEICFARYQTIKTAINTSPFDSSDLHQRPYKPDFVYQGQSITNLYSSSQCRAPS
jgi:hypothetical protein